MRDIYLIANRKFSNMDIIILFLFINLFTSTSFPPPTSRSTLCPPKFRSSFKIFHSLFHISRPLYRAKKKDYRLYHTRTHTYTCTHTYTHALEHGLSLMFPINLLSKLLVIVALVLITVFLPGFSCLSLSLSFLIYSLDSICMYIMYGSRFPLVSEAISAAAKTSAASSRVEDFDPASRTRNTVAVSSNGVRTKRGRKWEATRISYVEQSFQGKTTG